MAAATLKTQYIWTGQGPIYMGKYDATNGVAAKAYMTEMLPIGCGNRTLQITPNIETETIAESCSGARAVLKEFTKSKEIQVALSMVQFDGSMLARALMATPATVASGTVTGESLGSPAAGETVFLSKAGATNVVIKDSASGSPATLVKDTHYEITDADHGAIKILDMASFVPPLVADYENAGGINLPLLSAGNVEVSLAFTGLNDDKQKIRILIPRMSLKLDGDFDWISDEASELTLTGQVLYAAELATNPDYNGFALVTLI